MSPSTFGGKLLGTDRTPGAPVIAGRFDGDHVFAPLLTNAVPAVTDQLEIAAALSRPNGAALSVVNPVSIPDQTPASYCSDVASTDDEALLEWALDQTTEATPRTAGGLLYTRDVVGSVLSVVRTRDVDTVVLPSKLGSRRVRRGLTEKIAAFADCDVVVVNGRAGYDEVAPILLPVAGGPHSGLAADIARSIADDCNAWIDVLHVVDEDAPARERDRAVELTDDVARRIGRPETTTTWVLDADDVVDAITEQSNYYGLTVLGAPTKGRLRRFVAGSTNRSVRAKAQSVVLSVRNNSRD